MEKAPALPRLSADYLSLSGQLFNVLTAAYNGTITYLLHKGIAENTLSATRSDLNYLDSLVHLVPAGRSRLATGSPGLPSVHNTPSLLCGRTCRQSQALRALSRWPGVEHPFSLIEFIRTLRAAMQDSAKPWLRKSKWAVDTALIKYLLNRLVIFYFGAQRIDAENEARRLHSLRDRALPAVISAYNCPLWLGGIPGMGLRLGRTKTTDALGDVTVFLCGRRRLRKEDSCFSGAWNCLPSREPLGVDIRHLHLASICECCRQEATVRGWTRPGRSIGPRRECGLHHLGIEGRHSRRKSCSKRCTDRSTRSRNISKTSSSVRGCGALDLKDGAPGTTVRDVKQQFIGEIAQTSRLVS